MYIIPPIITGLLIQSQADTLEAREFLLYNRESLFLKKSIIITEAHIWNFCALIKLFGNIISSENKHEKIIKFDGLSGGMKPFYGCGETSKTKSLTQETKSWRNRIIVWINPVESIFIHYKAETARVSDNKEGPLQQLDLLVSPSVWTQIWHKVGICSGQWVKGHEPILAEGLGGAFTFVFSRETPPG